MADDRIFNFNGPTTFNDIHDNRDCTIIVPSPTENAQKTSSMKTKTDKPSATKRTKSENQVDDKEHGVARDTFLHCRHITENHLSLLLQTMQEDGWIGNQTSKTDFFALFSGKASSCEIVWTNQFGIGTLKELFETFKEEQLITLPAGARSVNSVIENHFVDTKGHFVSDVNSGTPAESAYQTIRKYVDILNIRLKTDENFEKVFDDFVTNDPSYR